VHRINEEPEVEILVINQYRDVTAHHLPAALAVMRRAARRQEIREAHLAVQNEAQKTKTKTQAAMGVHDK
jgi:hypothetical protein